MPERDLQAPPELAPRDRLRAAELDGRTRFPSASTARATALTRSLTQIGCTRWVPGADHGRDGGEAGDPQEPWQRTSVRPEDEARAEDDVLDARGRDRLLGRPLGAEVGNGRAGPRAEGAHQDDAPYRGLASRLDQIPGAGRHHALERGGRPLDDRHEVDDRAHAARGRAQRRGIRHVAPDELAVDPLERGRPARGPHHRPHACPARRQLADDVAADEPARARDQDHRSSAKFCQ